jgi:PTS system N-acetylglucosamine-specific IIC component
LPDYLAFFAGRRFIPIASGLAGLLLAAVFGGSWTTLDHAVDTASRAVLDLGPIGLFAYGVLNRLLIITGLHHILNNMAWFILGDYNGVTGDLNRFFAGDPTAGQFMSGHFPVMMFGLPAACLAMYHTAHADKKAAVGGMLLSMALTAMLTGVTEPIEFSFIFLAPVLFGLHALLTGLAMMTMNLLGIHLGFSFSAGLFDYLINFKLASRPLLLLPVGAVYALLYYGLFRLFIQRFNLSTPGRETERGPVVAFTGDRNDAFVAALGGSANLVTVDACTTRLRLIVVDQDKVNEAALRTLGAKGFVRPSLQALQVVLGPTADQVADGIRNTLARGDRTPGPQSDSRLAAEQLCGLLGGRDNVATLAVCGSRLLIEVRNATLVTDAALQTFAPRGVLQTAPTRWQMIIGGEAQELADACKI